MAVVNINTIKNWFKTGMIPTQAQFWSVFDSYRHKDDKVPVAEVEGINELLATRASQQVLDNHLAQKGAPNGYAPLDEFTKLAAQYLNIVNDLVTGGATALLSAEQGKFLQTQVSAINTLLTSDNVNLDTVQELVDAIETVQLSLSTILVNDLITGGTTKALTAEMGKQLDLIKESTANKSTSFVVDYLSNIKFPSVKAVYDFCMLAFKKKFLHFADVSGIAHTFGVGSENTMFKFSNNNPITATIPTNATTPLEIGTVFETIAIGNGALTVTGAPGVTILTNLSNSSVKNEVRRYTKIDTDTWSVEGNLKEKSNVMPFSVYVKSTGSDTIGKLNDYKLPFRTIDGAWNAIYNEQGLNGSHQNLSNYTLYILDSSTYEITINRSIYTMNIDCLSNTPTVIQKEYLYVLGNFTLKGQMTYKVEPLSSYNFSGMMLRIDFSQIYIDIYKLWVLKNGSTLNWFWRLFGSPVLLKCNIKYVESDILDLTYYNTEEIIGKASVYIGELKNCIFSIWGSNLDYVVNKINHTGGNKTISFRGQVQINSVVVSTATSILKIDYTNNIILGGGTFENTVFKGHQWSFAAERAPNFLRGSGTLSYKTNVNYVIEHDATLINTFTNKEINILKDLTLIIKDDTSGTRLQVAVVSANDFILDTTEYMFSPVTFDNVNFTLVGSTRPILNTGARLARNPNVRGVTFKNSNKFLGSTYIVAWTGTADPTTTLFLVSENGCIIHDGTDFCSDPSVKLHNVNKTTYSY